MVNRVQAEFGRQAAFMASAPAFNDEQSLGRIRSALGAGSCRRVLEIACGPGIVAEAIAPIVEELVCIDATSEMIALAETRLEKSGHMNVSFHQAFAEALPFEASSFDVVVTRLSLHHFSDVLAVLAEIHRVLRPQGRLIVVDIISSANREESQLHNALERLRDPSHVHMFTQLDLLSHLQSGMFNAVATETWGQRRTFSEWARIVSVPGRTDPLCTVVRTLCRAGIHAGIDLQESDEDISFTHTWLLVTAESTMSPTL